MLQHQNKDMLLIKNKSKITQKNLIILMSNYPYFERKSVLKLIKIIKNSPKRPFYA